MVLYSPQIRRALDVMSVALWSSVLAIIVVEFVAIHRVFQPAGTQVVVALVGLAVLASTASVWVRWRASLEATYDAAYMAGAMDQRRLDHSAARLGERDPSGDWPSVPMIDVHP